MARRNNGKGAGARGSDAVSTSMTRMASEHPSQQFGTKKVRRWLPVLAITYFMMVGATVAAAALLLFDFFGPDTDRPVAAQTETSQPVGQAVVSGIQGTDSTAMVSTDSDVSSGSTSSSTDSQSSATSMTDTDLADSGTTG